MTPDGDRTRLRSNAVLASAQVIVSAGVLFVLFHFIIRTLGAEAIGLWSVVMAITTAVRFGELGLGASSIRFVAMHLAQGAQEDAAATASTGTLSIAAMVFALCALLWPILNWALPLIVSAPGQLAEARALLPYAVGSVWLAAVSNSMTTALVGCHRADLSSIAQMGAQMLWLVTGLVLVPRMGLQGLALGQALQYLVLAIVGWLLLCRQLPALRRVLPRWSRRHFLAMWRYGAMQQLVSLAAMLGEPLAKILLAHFGTLSMLGYFEIANRLVSQVRMLVVAANQVLVPYFAKMAEISTHGLAAAYVWNLRIVILVGSFLFSLLGATLPAIGVLWIGHDEPWFVTFGLLLSFGWFANILAGPAFFSNAGTGRLGINLLAQLAISAVMAVVGVVAGALWGALGSALAWPAGLLAGTALMVVAYHRREQIPYAQAFDTAALVAIVFGGGVVAASVTIFRLLSPEQGLPTAAATSAAFAIGGWIAFFALSPQSRYLVKQLTTTRSHSDPVEV